MAFHKILVGVGRTETSLAAARWAAGQFAATATTVLVGCSRAGASGDRAPLRAELEPVLERLREELGAERTRALVRDGAPASCLAAAAAEFAVDLVCIGAPRPRELASLTGTAERLLHDCRAALLVVRGRVAGRPRRILASVDQSDLTDAVLRAVAELAQDAVHTAVVHALPHRYTGVAALLSSSRNAGELEGKQEAQARQWLEARLAAAGLPIASVEVLIGRGDPAHVIRHAAEQQGTDLIVAGNRGAGAVGRIVLGSVARSLVHEAPCPVLLVREHATQPSEASSGST
ncbi:MAG: universal stress protein [Longimicrobiales bacterium]